MAATFVFQTWMKVEVLITNTMRKANSQVLVLMPSILCC